MEHTKLYIYPIYIDSDITLQGGRRVSKEVGVSKPTAKEIEVAAKDLGYDAVLEEERRHPRDFWRFGRVIINFKTGEDAYKVPEINKRKDLLAKLSGTVKYNREHKPVAAAPKQKLRGTEKARAKRQAKK